MPPYVSDEDLIHYARVQAVFEWIDGLPIRWLQVGLFFCALGISQVLVLRAQLAFEWLLASLSLTAIFWISLNGILYVLFLLISALRHLIPCVRRVEKRLAYERQIAALRKSPAKVAVPVAEIPAPARPQRYYRRKNEYYDPVYYAPLLRKK